LDEKHSLLDVYTKILRESDEAYTKVKLINIDSKEYRKFI